jgi:hypothetical protein
MQKLIKTLALGVVVAWSATALAEEIKVGADWAKNKVEVGDAAEVKNKIVDTTGSIGIGPLAAEEANVIHSPESPEVGRPITAVTMGAPSTKVQKLFDFIATQGQQYIAR